MCFLNGNKSVYNEELLPSIIYLVKQLFCYSTVGPITT